MQLVVFTAVALCAMVIAYALGVNGTISGLIFLFILFNGVLKRVAEPLLARLRP